MWTKKTFTSNTFPSFNWYAVKFKIGMYNIG